MSTETIGEKLRHLREENGLPLRKVAATLDIDVVNRQQKVDTLF